ncbi:NIPSNAP family protein [Aestuariivita sp.]|jgi:heme-degrading monooxygenase HmoA|uniref:NIPSNAP family protein n=1 Tax=Aestuariivita sp. TaxID=1872407 RepID=UPI00216C7234|nr:NIPSNAP family protein [Aestuariivita sp.]MCE8009155.1 NIPSNAP family containing protein [Aestuariivita sp.]
MINQLRIYQVPPGNRGPFLDRFRDHAARIMTDRYGFRIQAMWTSDADEALRFVYLLAWNDEDEMADCWAAFMADAEWKDIKAATAAEHGDFVLGIEDLILHPTAFSHPIGEAS